MTDGQKRLEEHMTRTLYENNVNQKDLINGMMQAEAAGCSYEDGTLSFAFPVQKWQTNRVGSLHGGIIATAFDLTVAALARFYAGADFAPTVSLDIKYVRPAKEGDTVIVTARKISAGRRISQLVCEARDKATGKVIATGASVYLNIDTDKERR